MTRRALMLREAGCALALDEQQQPAGPVRRAQAAVALAGAAYVTFPSGSSSSLIGCAPRPRSRRRDASWDVRGVKEPV